VTTAECRANRCTEPATPGRFHTLCDGHTDQAARIVDNDRFGKES
jgi:hypothetical protein